MSKVICCWTLEQWTEHCRKSLDQKKFVVAIFIPSYAFDASLPYVRKMSAVFRFVKFFCMDLDAVVSVVVAGFMTSYIFNDFFFVLSELSKLFHPFVTFLEVDVELDAFANLSREWNVTTESSLIIISPEKELGRFDIDKGTHSLQGFAKMLTEHLGDDIFMEEDAEMVTEHSGDDILMEEVGSLAISCHTQEEWNKELKVAKDENKAVVVAFTLTQSPVFAPLNRLFRKITSWYGNGCVAFLIVDVEELKEVAEEWKVVFGHPNFLTLCGGEEVSRWQCFESNAHKWVENVMKFHQLITFHWDLKAFIKSDFL